jgi:hypothetical protein
MFGWGRKRAVEKRAKLLARMVTLITHGLKSKTYEQFVASFSNPGKEPDAFDRSNHELRFQMRISPTCWYDATASYPLRESPWVSLHGGGDDFGVLITVSPSAGITVGLHLASGQRAGRDARALIHSLHAIPGFRSFAAIERELGIR